MEFSKEELRELQETVNRAKERREQREKIEASMRRKEMTKKQRELGLKVIRADRLK